MAGISSRVAGKLENNKKYNGIEFDNDLDLNEYEAYYRDLDPQIGKWWQIDPRIEDGQESLSPYNSMANDPILKSDLLGDEPESANGPGPKAVYTICKELYNAYRLYSAGESISSALRQINPEDIITAVSPISMKAPDKEAMRRLLIPTGAYQGAAIAIDFIKQVKEELESEVVVNTKKDRVANQKSGEKAQNQLEGIEKKQLKEKKNASKQGGKQNKITSIKKSKQKLDNELKNIKSLKDAKEKF